MKNSCRRKIWVRRRSDARVGAFQRRYGIDIMMDLPGCIAVADVCSDISVRCRIVRPLSARDDDDPEVRAVGWEWG